MLFSATIFFHSNEFLTCRSLRNILGNIVIGCYPHFIQEKGIIHCIYDFSVFQSQSIYVKEKLWLRIAGVINLSLGVFHE